MGELSGISGSAGSWTPASPVVSEPVSEASVPPLFSPLSWPSSEGAAAVRLVRAVHDGGVLALRRGLFGGLPENKASAEKDEA